MIRKMLALACCLVLLAVTPALGEDAVTVTEGGLTLGNARVAYPVVSGLGDRDAQVNALIVSMTGADAWIDRMALVMQDPSGLQVTWSVSGRALEGRVLSCVLEASGALYDTRPSHAWGTAVIDLDTAQPVTFADLFTNETAAREALETLLEEQVAPELNPYLTENQVTPLPDSFAVDETGLTLYYPVSQLSTLSDRAGSIHIGWFELEELVNTAEGGIPDRIGAVALMTPDAAAIEETAASGKLPGIPVTLGGSLQEATDTWHLLNDFDMTEDNRLFELEAACFRNVYLLTDRLGETWENSVIQGIRSDRICLYGLKTGVTTLEEWRALLGDPDATIVLDEEKADSQRLVPGTSDYYYEGEYTLRLHADGDGVLTSLFLTQ